MILSWIPFTTPMVAVVVAAAEGQPLAVWGPLGSDWRQCINSIDAREENRQRLLEIATEINSQRLVEIINDSYEGAAPPAACT